MATTRTKAEEFIKELQRIEAELRKKFGIDREDVVVNAWFTVHETVRYSSAEDED